MLYDPFTPAAKSRKPLSMTYGTFEKDIPLPTAIPTTTKPITIPNKTPLHPSLYADYTDYGEAFFDDPLDYDALDDMIMLERMPNRRDSGYETPSSPVEKLQREEHHIQEGIPAMWAGEHDISHHVNVSTHRSRPRRSSSLLSVLSPPYSGDITRKDSVPQDHEHSSGWPAKTTARCPTCKAALKWKYLTEGHASTPLSSSMCVCQAPATPTKRHRRDACGEEESLDRMSRFVEEHLSWPVGL